MSEYITVNKVKCWFEKHCFSYIYILVHAGMHECTVTCKMHILLRDILRRNVKPLINTDVFLLGRFTNGGLYSGRKEGY
jgi:hypothetical protein